MRRLQVEEVQKANKELEELTNIFVRWGNDLNDGQQVAETHSTFKLRSIKESSEGADGNVSYDDENTAYDVIHDDFSLSKIFGDLISKL